MVRKELVSISGSASLTRISVSGSGQDYLVRNGDERPVRVRVVEDRLLCECGKVYCAHIASLEMCGFLEPGHQQRRAA